jgi:deoxyribonuclease-1
VPGSPDASGADASGADAGGIPCDVEKVQYGGCPGGDLITPCLDGYYGAAFCQYYDAGPADVATDAGWDIGPFPDAGPDPYADLYKGTADLTDDALRGALYELVKDHNGLGFSGAKQVLYADVDNDNGWVECVYTGIRVQTTGIPPNSVMNTEHTWPQSKGADTEPARGDLNHLFPTDSKANSRRNNNDYGWVETPTWTQGGSKLGAGIGGVTVFEPRDQHKGNAARAMFYFSVRYQMHIAQDEEEALKIWNHLDPPDDRERTRNTTIEGYQKTRNPFVDHPEFADKIADF